MTLIDSYLQSIQEIYQLADVYLFPVMDIENCIDVPLSVLEAASCNLPIVTTEYGELTAFREQEGFLFIDALDSDSLNQALEKALLKTEVNLVLYKEALTQSNTTHKSVPLILSAADACHYEFLYTHKSILTAFKEAGFYISGCCIWKKNALGLGRSP